MKKLLFFIFLFTSISSYSAIIQTTAGGGDWSAASTWAGGIIPGASDVVVVNTGDSLIVSDTRTCLTIAVAYGNSASYLKITSSGDLTVTSTSANDIVVGNFPVFAPYDFSIIVDGNFTIDNLAFVASRLGVIFNLTVNGTMTVTNTFQITHSGTGDNCPSTITVGNSGTFTCKDFRYRSPSNTANTLDLTNNGSFVCSSVFNISISEDCIANVNIDDKMELGSVQSFTNNDNSQCYLNVRDSLIVSSTLRIQSLTTATKTENQLNMDFNGAYCSFAFLVLFDGAINSTIGNPSTIEQISASGFVPLTVDPDITYHNLVLNVTGTNFEIKGDPLTQSNLLGDLTIKSGCTLTLESIDDATPRSLGVNGDLIINGKIVDKGSGITVGGDLSITSEIDVEGGNIAVTGNFTNSGTYNTITKSDKVSVTGNFTNSGTFDAEIDSLVITGNFDNQATYTSAGNNIYLDGDWDNSGTYTSSDGDSVIFQGSAKQAITGTTSFDEMIINNSAGVDINSGTTSLISLLDILSGTLDTKGNLIFISDATETAALADLTGGGSITGNVTVQRFLDEGNGWYMLGSPVTTTTLADWNTELPMSGFTGSDEVGNPFVSVYTYDETIRPPGVGFADGVVDSGYVEAGNITDVVLPGKGHFIYFEDVKAGNTAKTTDVVGALQTGPVSLDVTYSTKHFDGVHNGWNMLSNPFAAPVQWSNVTKTNLQGSNAAHRLLSNGTYQAFTSGIIYSGEAFWVQADGTPFTNPAGDQTNTFSNAITFNENDKVVGTDAYNTKQQPTVWEKYVQPLKMKLSYTKDPAYEDISELRLADNATPLYDKDRDVRKIGNAYGTFPNIASTSAADTSNEDLIWNTLSPNDDNVTIPVRIWTKFPSNTVETYTITFDNIKEWNTNNTCILLWDSVTNTTQKLDEFNNQYTFTANDTITVPRIFLTYSTPLETSFTNATCFGFNDGTASVEGDGSGNHTYTWLDENGNIVLKDKDITGKSTANNLSAGTYQVWVSRNGDCGTVAAKIVISEPEPIIADFTSDKDTVFTNTNATVQFMNSSINAIDYFWDFGDGTTSTLENPTHSYQEGGVYNVMMIASEGACSDTLFSTISVVDNVGINELVDENTIEIYQQGDQTFVEFNLSQEQNATITMHDVLGRDVIKNVNLNNIRNNKIELSVPQSLFGVYTISVYTEKDRVSKKLYYTKQ